MMVGKQWGRDEACTDEQVRQAYMIQVKEASSNNGYETEGKAFSYNIS